MKSSMSVQALRSYQETAVDSVQNVNSIVKMPTGSGKTLVAAEVIKRHIANGDCRGILFLVPSTELVEQQADVLHDWCCSNGGNGLTKVIKYFGGMAPPSMLNPRHILVATAGAFLNLKDMNQKYFGWHNFSLCVFDEVHHAIKDHPFRKAALQLSHFRSQAVVRNEEKKCDWDDVQILGLTASLTYEVIEKKMETAVANLCSDLCIQKMVSPTSSELLKGGYVPPCEDCVEVERYNEAPAGVVPPYGRKNHEMYGTFMKRVERRESTPFSLSVWEVIQNLENKVTHLLPSFKSPLSNGKLKAWEEYVHEYATDYSFSPNVPKVLEYWYVALRILVQTWEEDEEIVRHWLSYNRAFNLEALDDVLLDANVHAVQACTENQSDHSKVSRLCRHLTEKKLKYGDDFRCIVFVQQQVTAHILGEHVLNDSSQFCQDCDVKAGFVVSRGSKITPSIRFTNTMAAETIKAFREGVINVLVATSVIEEGFDVPAANVVVCYDHMKDAVEFCQRFGRARQGNRSIVVLDERHDRPVEMLRSIQLAQDNIVHAFDPNNVVIDEEFERTKQKQREINAYKKILRDCNVYESEPLKKLNEYVKVTKATIENDMETNYGQHSCELKYTSLLREANGSGLASRKKDAKNDAARDILQFLHSELKLAYGID